MTEPMSDEQLAAIRARVEAATAGPWTVRDLYVIASGDMHIGDFEWLADTNAEWAEFKANAVFAAAARQDVPDLLAEVERLRTSMTYIRGPEECLERECEEYFDDEGEERPDVEYCSHLKVEPLSVHDHLAVLAERDDARHAVAEARAALDRASAEMAAVRSQLDRSTTTHEENAKAITELSAERDAARAARDGFAAELDRLGGHLTDPRLIRLAISDPGAFVKREKFENGDYESIPAWGARAVVEVLKNGRGAA
ncbi:hypothetical protein [Actinomadura nitritigenes]|uniref:hypothetical protein n=1 Tax=Actinomadura nitritigenes TaxID=134602 RepID=UPI003D93C314